jgi:hypothetical protein
MNPLFIKEEERKLKKEFKSALFCTVFKKQLLRVQYGLNMEVRLAK